MLVLLMLSGSYMFEAFIALVIVALLAILIVPFFLIQNGIVMIRREGKSLSNLLSLFFGILIGIGEITTFLTMMSIVFAANDNQVFVDLVKNLGLPFSVFSVSVIYVSVSFLIRRDGREKNRLICSSILQLSYGNGMQ